MSDKAENTKPTPMEWESHHIPHPLHLRSRQSALAEEAADLTAAQIDERAAEAGVSTSGTRTKADKVERVKGAAPSA